MLIPFVRPIAILISLLVLGAGGAVLWQWQRGLLLIGPDGAMTSASGPLWQLLLGLALLGLSAGGGRWLVLLALRSRGPYRDERPAERRELIAPDGTRIDMQAAGPAGAPVIVMTHGWGLTSRAFAPIRERLAGAYRVVSWDLPGLGRSAEPPDGEYLIDRFAQALGTVVAATGAERVILVGHSIGGMTSQTFWRACPDTVKARIVGMVLVHTTHLNPLATMWLSSLWLTLQKPVIEPMQRLTIALSPLVWISTWQSYLSGSLHLTNRLVSFGRHATREAVELSARLSAEAKPSVQAKGILAMLHWRVSEDLALVEVPTLVIAGRKDIVTEPRAGAEIADRVPKARLRYIEGVGHLGYLELEDEYASAIADFAGEVMTTSTRAAVATTSA